MTVTYRLVHRTTYTYDAPVTASYGRAHLLPRDTGTQRRISARLTVSPAAVEIREHTDYFANTSTYYRVDQPHDVLDVTARSEIAVDRPTPDPDALHATSWERVRDSVPAVDEERGFLLASPLVAPAAAADYAAAIFRPRRALGAALHELLARIAQDFEYKSGATTVRTTLPEVLATRSGVCQDFAHLVIGCLRSVGLAARYVSGYLETEPAPGQEKLRGADASHAWASVLVPGLGWVDLDPTNDQFVDDRYVVAAWGRDYTDVPPLKGVIFTDAKLSTLRVSVDLARIAESIGD